MSKEEKKEKAPRDGRWNFQENQWEERKGKRNKKTEQINWGPWEPSNRRAPTFSQKAVAERLKNMREILRIAQEWQQYGRELEEEGATNTEPYSTWKENTFRVEELQQEANVSICGLGKHFHKSNAAVKKKIRALVKKVVGDDKEAQQEAYKNLTDGIPDYTESELRERAKQADESFLAEDITAILGVKIFSQGADD